MENTEIKEKLEGIEVLLSAFIRSANDPQKKKLEGEVLTKAIDSINSAQKEISGLILEEKTLIQNFKPAVEVKHYNLDIKKPLYWYTGVAIFTCLNILVMALFFNTLQDYKKQAKDYYPNYMKYRYMEFYFTPESIETMNKLDKDYEAEGAKMDEQIIQRQHDVDVANATKTNAKILKDKADKAEQEAREAAKKLH